MRTLAKFTIIFLFISAKLRGQNSEIDRLVTSELKMSFPSIYFKHNSSDYASMPYSVDSSFKYIALHFDNNINSLVIWRDTAETEELTFKRIKKLKSALKKYLKTKSLEIYSMDNEQKVSRQTIKMTTDSSKIKYLLSLNSVFDISKTRRPNTSNMNNPSPHILHPRLFCWGCLIHGYHLDKKSRNLRKVARRAKQNKDTSAK